jgi:methylated-DNA-protein-cysteine methyltransferase related protein
MKISEQHKDFFESVWEIVRLIPEGKVTTYGHIARVLGTPKSSRMVGWAMNACHKFPDIPAHRVVNRNGMLTGKMHFAPPESMEERLTAEGVIVQNDRIENFKQHLWDPNQFFEEE